LQALCKMYHTVKTKRFMMNRNTKQEREENISKDEDTSESENASESDTETSEEESDSENNTFECKCGVKVATGFSLRRHQNSKCCTAYANTKRECKCKYEGCKYACPRLDNLARHMKTCKYRVNNSDAST